MGQQGSVLIWTSIHPGAGHAEQVSLVWPIAKSPIVMIEDDIPIPRDRWEFRTSGLWVEQVCETPLEHWSFGLEAFALELDTPTELLRTGHGRRVPMGWELDFVGSGPARWVLTSSDPLERAGAYTQRGTLEGLLLDAAGEQEFDGRAQRWHWWGNTPFSAAGIRNDPGATAHTNDAKEPLSDVAELHLPLSQGPVVVRSSPSMLSIGSSATIC